MKLFLIRHGQTTANFKKNFVGQSDVPLPETGRQQAEAIRPILAKFPFDRVFSSDLSRAIDTQKISLPFEGAERTELLREYSVGTLEGRNWEEFYANGQNAEIRKTRNYTSFGGENSEMVQSRVRKFLKELEDSPSDYVAAFAHCGLMTVFLQVVLGASFDHRITQTPNCAIHVFEYDGNKWSLLAWNYMKEL